MIYEKEEDIPEDFKPAFDVAACFINHEGKVLMLLTQDYKKSGSKWGSPAGKIKENESSEDALIREVKEETGIILEKKDLFFHKKVFARHPKEDFVYYIYGINLKEKPKVVIDINENKEFLWLSPEDSLKLDLISEEDWCIKDFYNL